MAGNTAARGFDGQREPTSNEVATEVPPDAAKGGKNFRATIPVYFHVVHDGPVANLTQKQIDDQIRVMNFGFAGLEGGYDTGFRFELAGVTRTDNPLWLHHGYGDKYEREMKRAPTRAGAWRSTSTRPRQTRTSAGRTSRTSRTRACTSTASWSTGSPCRAPRPGTRACTTSGNAADACYEEFTEGQAARMRAAWLHLRA